MAAPYAAVSPDTSSGQDHGQSRDGGPLAPQLRCIDRLGDEPIMRSQSRLGRVRAINAATRTGELGLPRARMPHMPKARSTGAAPDRWHALLIAAGACLIAASAASCAKGRLVAVGRKSGARPTPREPVYRPPARRPRLPRPPAPGQPAGTGQPGRRPANWPAQWQHLRAAGAAAGGGRRRAAIRARPAAQDRERHAPAGAQTYQVRRSSSSNRADCWDQFLFFAHACAHAAIAISSPARWKTTAAPSRSRGAAPADHGLAQPILPGRHHPRARPQQLRPQYAQEARRREAARNPFSTLWRTRRAMRPRGSPNHSATCLSPPTGRCACGCATATTSRSSFSTLPNHFQRDAERASRNARRPPSSIIIRIPAGRSSRWCRRAHQQPYTSLKTACRYRKEFVQGCSCKQAEYVPQTPAPAVHCPIAAPKVSPRRQRRRRLAL